LYYEKWAGASLEELWRCCSSSVAGAVAAVALSQQLLQQCGAVAAAPLQALLQRLQQSLPGRVWRMTIIFVLLYQYSKHLGCIPTLLQTVFVRLYK
jgi:hypothetical protein